MRQIERADLSDADLKFEAIYGGEWDWRQRQLPDQEDGQLPIAEHLPHVDAAHEEERLGHWREVAAELGGIAEDQLSEANRVSLAVYRAQLEDLLGQQRFRQFEMPANSDSSFWSDLGYTARRTFRELRDYQAWISQMGDVPRYFEEQMEQMRAGVRRGFTPPRVTMSGRDAGLSTVIDARPEESVFFTPFRRLGPSVSAVRADELRQQALDVIRTRVQPAHLSLLRFLRDEYLPACRESLAASQLPEGDEYYRFLIRRFTTLGTEPERIHQLGEEEVERLDGEMAEAAREAGAKVPLERFLEQLRSDPAQYASTPEQLLHLGAWISKVFDGRAATYFGHLPRRRFTIRPVPEEMAPFYTSARGGPDEYLINTYDLAHRPLYNLTALTLHEAAPGHAFQMALALEQEDLPAFRRHTYVDAYGEGWALYCEWLGREMGMYETPLDLLGMLGYQAWRAARLVVDTGVHALGWSRERAQRYLRRHTTLPEHEIETEVDRYIAWPAQALAYYLGEMAIREARAAAEGALGERFNLRAFHDQVLSLGCVPLPVLRAELDRFVSAGGLGPYPSEE